MKKACLQFKGLIQNAQQSVNTNLSNLYTNLIPNLFDTSRSQICVWFRFQCVSPSSIRKQEQNQKNSNLEGSKEANILKDGLGPDQEMLSYPIKFIKVNIFINTVILGSA